MPRCVITGATGLIGSHVLPELARDWEVVAVTRRPPPAADGGATIAHVPLDLAAPWNAAGLPAEADVVVHLAQSAAFREFPDRAQEILTVNTHSTVRLLDYARATGARTFVLASSGGIGDSHAPPRDLGFYLGTKLCAEILAKAYLPYLNIVILRFFFVYGPGQRADMLIPRLVTSVREGRPIMLQGPDGLRLNPTDVTDAARAVQLAMTLDHSANIDIAGPDVVSLRELGAIIGRYVHRAPAFAQTDDTAPNHLVADTGEMSRLLAPPHVSVDAGLRRFIRATYPELA